jgi:hypothetical protein
LSCTEVQSRLTAYLDGELDADRGSAVRGHLRECAACRLVARDEAALRDGLRTLPTLDPPPSLWAGVQAQLAAAEVADAKRPAWRRALARWAPRAPTFAAGGLAAAAAITVLWWRAHRSPADEPTPPPSPVATHVAPAPTPAKPGTPDVRAHGVMAPAGNDDVTADLAHDAERASASYAQAADELVALATEARTQWSDERKVAFDTKLVELRATIDHVAEGRPRQRAWRELIRYLQGAVIRDDIALAGGTR